MDLETIKENWSPTDYTRMTTIIVSAYLRYNRIPAEQLPDLISMTASAIIGINAENVSVETSRSRVTPAEIEASITPAALISFEDGRKYKILKRHLTALGMTPDTYREKWGLPPDYPMAAPNYRRKRSVIARDLMLRRYRDEPAR